MARCECVLSVHANVQGVGVCHASVVMVWNADVCGSDRAMLVDSVLWRIHVQGSHGRIAASMSMDILRTVLSRKRVPILPTTKGHGEGAIFHRGQVSSVFWPQVESVVTNNTTSLDTPSISEVDGNVVSTLFESSAVAKLHTPWTVGRRVRSEPEIERKMSWNCSSALIRKDIVCLLLPVRESRADAAPQPLRFTGHAHQVKLQWRAVHQPKCQAARDWDVAASSSVAGSSSGVMEKTTGPKRPASPQGHVCGCGRDVWTATCWERSNANRPGEQHRSVWASF